MTAYDVVVIGSGPGGYVAAIRAAQLGLETVCIEKESLGGVCLNWGCIPSKALIHAAGFYEKARTRAATMGVIVDARVDVERMQAWKETIVKRLTTNVGVLIQGAKGEVRMGTARVVSPSRVEVTGPGGSKETIDAARGIVVATGATTIALPALPVDGEVVLTAKELVSLRRIPRTLAIVGGGVIGMELGMVYQKLGAKVIVVELADQLLGATDLDLVRVVERKLVEAGGEIHYRTKATGVSVSNGRATLAIAGADGAKNEIVADVVAVAVGFRPNGRGLGLEEIGVALDARGHVLTDARCETNVKGVYAIGDVSGGPYLAHKASKEAEICAEAIAGHRVAKDWRAMPAAIFTDPEIATVGMSERDCEAAGRKVRVGKFPFSASGRAMAVLAQEGFVKSIVDADTHEVLGVGIVGPEASDLISEAALAIEMCAYAEDVHLTIHPHPTLGEATMESFKHALGEAIHIANRSR